MSLASNLQDAFTRVATEFRAIRTLIGGSATAGIGNLTTASKASLVDAINEVKVTADNAATEGGAASLNELTDVAVTAPQADHILRHDGTEFVNVLGSAHYQPVDPDLTALAALTTTEYGRAFLSLVNQAALMGLLSDASETTRGVVELASTIEAVDGTDSLLAVTPAGLKASVDAMRESILGSGVPAALDTLAELAAALGDDENFAATVTQSLANKQPLDDDLTSIAAVASAANKMLYATGPGTWALTDLSPFGRSLLDDADAADARGTLEVYGTADIGDPNTDFVATFNAALSA